MNEKIKQLAEEAGFETDRGPLIVPAPYIRVGGLCVGVPLQKFVELIVEECRYVIDCNKGSDQNPAWNQALWETSEKIKQHFGMTHTQVEQSKPNLRRRTMDDGYYDAWMENPMAKTLKQSHQDTHPQPKREWVGLTDEDWQDVSEQTGLILWSEVKQVIEAKLKEKNT